MKEMWQKLPKKQQNQYLLLLSALLIMAYGAWYFQLSKEVEHAQSMLDRRVNRLESRAASVAEPVGNLGAMQRSLDKLVVQVASAEKGYEGLRKRFLPLESSSLRQLLKTEIAEKASSLGMRIKRFEDGSRPDNEESAPGSELALQEVNNRYSRPLMLFETKTTYFRLLEFLDALNGLSYHVSPVKVLKLEAWTPDDYSANAALQQNQIIDVGLLLAL